jgi:endonuclease/exonuclease/phosphatase family metal-dependent hydrolase/vacuolar-type H+-ATPase subunit H
MINPTLFDELEAMVDGTVNGSEFFGDPLNENPDRNTTRIYIQNLNGLTWNSDGGRWPYVCETMDSIQADIACFSELNTDTNRYEIRTKMEQICRRQFDQNYLVLASAANKTTTHYKPGGTAILSRNAITSRIKTHTRDRMGRWASISFTISTTKKLRVISAYQVCSNAKPGTNTAASHQNAQIIAEHVSDQDIQRKTPRQAFIQDLQNFIKQIQAEGEEVILAGDFNDDITLPQSGMHQLATTCCLVDLFSIRLGTTNSPITYQRGSKRLDYILISPNLLPMVQAAGYDPFGYRLPSDHRGMYIDLSTHELFDQELPQIQAAHKRDFRTSTPGVIQAYVMAKIKYLQDHRFFERLQILNDLHESNHVLAESLDRDFERASFHAANKCSKKPRAPWSPALASAWAEIHYYRVLISAKRTNANYLPAITKLQSQCPELPKDYPDDIQALQEMQRQALDRLKEARLQAQNLREEYLTKRHAYYAENDDRRRAKILQRIIRAESQQKVYTKIKNIRNQESSSFSLSSLKVPLDKSLIGTDEIKQLPDDQDHWETITVPEDIERLLIRRINITSVRQKVPPSQAHLSRQILATKEMDVPSK